MTPTAAPHVASEHDLALARQFFEGGPQNHAFSMQHAPDLARMGEIPAPMGEPWTMEQRRQLPMEEAAKGAWAAEFGGAPQLNAPGLHQTGPGVSECKRLDKNTGGKAHLLQTKPRCPPIWVKWVDMACLVLSACTG